jgi:hypothetical protein
VETSLTSLSISVPRCTDRPLPPRNVRVDVKRLFNDDHELFFFFFFFLSFIFVVVDLEVGDRGGSFGGADLEVDDRGESIDRVVVEESGDFGGRF